MPTKIILDVDTGTDDAIALMTAALSPDIELIGATSVNGNCPVDICTDNTLRVFDYIGVDIPVYEGCAIPLISTLTPGRRPNMPRKDPSIVHGHYLDLPAPTSEKQSQHAIDWLIETYMASDGDITLVPVGPLTNIAMAIRKDPRFLEKVPELVIMGGGHEVGNSTPSAEFNFWADPEAARIVMNCGRPIRLVPLDATHKALFSRQTCTNLRKIGTPAAVASAIVAEQRIEAYNKWQPMDEIDSSPIHDALCVCAIIDPTVISTVFVNVDVETFGELTDGRSVCDVHHRSGKEPNTHLALNTDSQKFVDMMTEILSRTA